MKPGKPSTGYPFVTRRQVIERLDRDPAFVRECVEILHRRYADRDRLPPPAGWMASHRKLGEEIFVRLASADRTAADVVAGAALAKRYSKQLTRLLRDEQLAREPGLGLVAAVFGIRRSDPEAEDPGDDPYAPDDAEQANVPGESVAAPPPAVDRAPVSVPPPAVHAPPRRRPGRPKGSKNKIKSDGREQTPKKGRRR